MAVIKPFKAIRYNQNVVDDLAAVITPPYDVIDSDEQERLHQKSPYNIVRLEYGKVHPSDSMADNRYTRAAATLRQWLDQKVLVLDPVCNYYLYEQSFYYRRKLYQRRGLMAALKLEPYKNKVVLPHELTMRGPKQDRLQLLTHTRVNTSPIFALCPDSDPGMEVFFATAAKKDPLLEAVEDSGQTHRLWPVDDPRLQDQISSYLAPQPLLIADGHHRYETALAFFENSKSGQAPGSEFILATIVSIKDPGLLMLPTHRLLFNLGSGGKKRLLDLIEKEFSTEYRVDLQLMDPKCYLQRLEEISGEKSGFGCILDEEVMLLVPRAKPDSLALPVSLLHDLLLKPLLNKGESGEDSLSFFHEFESALSAMRSNKADAAFILAATAIEAVFDRARRGAIMPQKSTYFFPKLPGGLALYHLDSSY